MTGKKNNKSESKNEQPKLNQEQYDRLLKCSEKGPEGIKEWNQWRKENREEEIWLQVAKLSLTKLQGADLGHANLQGTKLLGAELQGASLMFANLQEADLNRANLQGADLLLANLQGADLTFANLQGAKLDEAKLQGADLDNVKLQGANLTLANLQGAELLLAELQGTKLKGAIVNGSTNFLGCKVDKDTDFRETGLENIRIKSGTKTLLKYNIRRMNWENWYKKSKWWQWPIRNIFVRMFWWMSDYGKSTGRIFAWFFGLALVFSLDYWAESGLVLVGGGADKIRGFVHALYFSVVTMTTLGFGDIAANPDSRPGQVLLMVQVILGYILLGAMVTRLAVLFTSDGPADSFTPMSKKTKKLLAKLKKEEDR